MQFSANDLTQLTNLLTPDTDSPPEGVFSTDSVLGPGNLGSQESSKPKASPNHKVKATINREPEKPKKTFEANGRPEPDHEVIYQQSLKAEEAYLGFTDKDPLSNSSSHMTLRSVWPAHCSAQISIESDAQKIILFSERLFLEYHMPYPFDFSRGKARFVKDKWQLEVTVPRVEPSFPHE